MNYLFDPLNYDPTDPSSIPNLLIQHLTIVGISMLISIIIAVPLGIFIARRRSLQAPVIGVTGLLYTIPSLALFIILHLVLGTKILDPINVIVAMTIYAVYVSIHYLWVSNTDLRL